MRGEVLMNTRPTKATPRKWGDVLPGTIKGPMGLPVSYSVKAYEGKAINDKLSKANKGILRARAHNPVA